MAEIIVEPTALSKVIPLKFKINDVDVPKTTQLSTNKQFNTTDTDAWFTFELDGLASINGTYDLTLINLDDESIFHHADVIFPALPFHYKLNSSEDVTLNEIRHAGRWLGQLVVTLSNGDTTARQFGFNIAGHILDGQDAQVILLSDYQALINTINLAKDDLAQHNVDYAALLVDIAAAEDARVTAYNQLLADQQANIEAFDVALDDGIVAANLATKLQDFETTNNSRLLSAEQQLAHKVGGLISVLAYGADPTGVADSTAAFNNAISYLRTTIINSNFQIGGEILIPAGVYKITGKVTISPFVHLKTQGFVHIRSTVASGSTLHFTAQAGDPTFLTLMNKQQYLRSPFINAKDGGMLISSTLGLAQAGTIGLEIGSRTNLGASLPTSRYAICDVAIDNFDVGLQMNIYNNYIGRFENLHIEENNTAVKFGTTTAQTVVNSGENFNFYSCVFAGGNIGFDWFSDGMNCNFYGCSFDFIGTVFNARQNWRQVTINGGHIEGAITVIDTSLATAPIDLVSPSTFYLNAPVIFCNGVASKNTPLFKGKMVLHSDNVKWQRTVTTIDSFLYASNDATIMAKEIGHTMQGINESDIVLSPTLNCIRNSKFQLSDLTAGDAIAPFSGYTVDKGSAITPVVTATIPTGSPYTRALKVGATADTGFWTHLVTDSYDVNPGDIVQIGAVAYLNVVGSAKRIVLYASFYDAAGTLILNTTEYAYTEGSTDPTKWYTFFGKKYLVAPAGSKTVKVHCTFAGLKTGEIAYLGEFFLGIS